MMMKVKFLKPIGRFAAVKLSMVTRKILVLQDTARIQSQQIKLQFLLRVVQLQFSSTSKITCIKQKSTYIYVDFIRQLASLTLCESL